jgi:hypothetical protein
MRSRNQPSDSAASNQIAAMLLPLHVPLLAPPARLPACPRVKLLLSELPDKSTHPRPRDMKDEH